MASRTSAPVAPIFDFDFDAPPSKKPAIPTFDAPDFDQAAFDALSPRSKENASSAGKSKSLKQKSSASPTSTQIDGPPQTPTKTRKVSSSDLANQAKAGQEQQESKQSAPAKKPKKALKKAMSAQVTSSAKKQAEEEEEQDENTPPPAPKKASKPAIKNINAISEDQELDDNKLDMIRAAGDSDEEEAPAPSKSRKPRYSETPKASSSASSKKIARTQSSAVNESNPANPSSSGRVGVIGGIDEEDDKVESSTGTSGPVDAWEKMLDGSVMMKFGKAGEPHFRIVGLTEDKKYVVYFSKGKKRSQTKIEVAKIIKITEGLKGKGFTNAIALAGEFRNLCFSIWYDKDNTLDLMAADENDYKIWTKGLLSLVEEAKNPTGLVNGCMVDLKAQDRFNRTKLIAENRRMVKERKAIQDDFTKINKRLNDILAYTEDMRILHAFTRSETWIYAQKILDYLKKVKDLRVDTGNINELDYEAWWMQAQLEALQNLMEAVDVHI